MKGKEFTAQDFKKELQSVLPAYKWTVERGSSNTSLCAMGKKSSGSNRTSTILVTRKSTDIGGFYTAKADTNFAWDNYASMRCCSNLTEYQDSALKRCIRGLQNYHEDKARRHERIAVEIQISRTVQS